MAIRRFPPAQPAIIRLKVLPTPAVEITLTTIPTVQSSTAVIIMPFAPITRASKTAFGPMRFSVSQLEAMTAMIPNTAAYVGVNPMTSIVIRPAIGITKLAPPLRKAEPRVSPSDGMGCRLRRRASILTKNATDRK